MSRPGERQRLELHVPGSDDQPVQVRRGNSTTWENFYDDIVGLNLAPGTDYELVVKVTTVDDPPADGSSLRYELVAVISPTSHA